MKFNDKEFAYSVSQNRTYNDCPRKYRFRYKDGIKEPSNPNLDLGNAIHKLLEDDFVVLNDKIDNVKARDYLIRNLSTLYFERLQTQINEFFKNKKIVSRETLLYCNFDGSLNERSDKTADFVVKIDVVYEDEKGRTVIADYKVTKKPKTVQSVIDEEQLIIYKYYYCKALNLPFDKVAIQYINILPYLCDEIVRPTKLFGLPEESCEIFKDSMLDNVHLIENGEFPKKKKWCNWCYYKDMCMKEDD